MFPVFPLSYQRMDYNLLGFDECLSHVRVTRTLAEIVRPTISIIIRFARAGEWWATQ